MSRIMISVGEASGDIHGASVAAALQRLQPDTELFGMGGSRMREAGVDIVYDIADLGVIGVVEVVKNLRRLFRLRDFLSKLMDERRPDALLIIDYPGFNMKLAKVAKEKGIPVISYISPSVWAWGRGRAKTVAATVAKVAAVFPFEADIYRSYGADVEFVGHPLLDIVKPSMDRAAAYSYFGANPDKPVVMLMPGSRLQEIMNLLPPMLAAAQKLSVQLPGVQFFLPLASTIPQALIKELLAKFAVEVRLTLDCNYDLMNIADVAIAASGTATLEAALLGLPSVIIYKVAALTYLLGRLLVKIPDIGLPNIVAGRKILPELLQGEANPDNISRETIDILTNTTKRDTIRRDLLMVRQKLGSTGAVDKVAQLVLAVAGSGEE